MKDDNIYRIARKKAALENSLLNSLETAQDVLCIDRLRLLKIENGQKIPDPEDIVTMVKAYDSPELRNYYCSKECPLGSGSEPLMYDDLDKISVRLMSSLHFLENAEDKIFSILEDGKVTDNERAEFHNILDTLDKIAYSAKSLKLWAEKNGFE